MNVYLAGGAVRDLLLGRSIHDRDYLVTNTTKQEFQQRFPCAVEVGRAFPIFLIQKLEFSFPRGNTLEKELESRDLTVNAILLDENGELICHPQALEDLRDKILRPASLQSFIDDPLRVFRAARFWAQFPDFTPHKSLIDAMHTVVSLELLNGVAADRVGQETIKALHSPAPGNYLRLLTKGNCLKPWFADFTQGVNMPAGPPQYHDSDVVEHTCRTMDQLAGDAKAVWMGLCHDIGKTRTQKQFLPRHHGHDKRGIKMAEELANRIRLSNEYVTAGLKAAKWHMIAGRYDELRPGTRVDLLMDLHLSKIFPQLFSLIKADQSKDFLKVAQGDLSKILPVRLPPEDMNLGRKSGEILRELRARKLPKQVKL